MIQSLAKTLLSEAESQGYSVAKFVVVKDKLAIMLNRQAKGEAASNESGTLEWLCKELEVSHVE